MKKTLKYILLSFVCMVVVGTTASYSQTENKIEQMKHLESLKLPSNAFQNRWQADYVGKGFGLNFGIDRNNNTRVNASLSRAWRVFMLDIGFGACFNDSILRYKKEISTYHYYDCTKKKNGFLFSVTPQFYYYYFSIGCKLGTLFDRNTITYEREVLQEIIGNGWCVKETVTESNNKTETETNVYFNTGPIIKLFPIRIFGGRFPMYVSIGYDVFLGGNIEKCKTMNGWNYGLGACVDLNK